MQGAVSLEALAAMPEDQHHELAAWVRDLDRKPARAAGDQAPDDDSEPDADADGPLLDFDEELAKG